MDFFYLPWISALNPEEETEHTVNSLPESIVIKPKYKLTFFQGKGFVEISRLVLAYSGEPFIDNRICYIKWKETEDGGFLRCSNLRTFVLIDPLFSRIPMLEFDGHTIYQSITIAKFLAKQFGLYGRTIYEEAQVDEIMELLLSLANYLKPYVFSFLKTRNPKISWKEYFPEISIGDAIPMIERYLPFLDNIASRKTNHGFLIPSGLTYADFAVTICYEFIEYLIPQTAASYTNLKALKNKVNSLPQLQEYLKNRPESMF